MSFFISTNTAALRAGYNLGLNIRAQNKSIDLLSSGQKITKSSDDPGALAVSMKLNSVMNRLSGAISNVQNAISYLEVQDGALGNVGDIMERMSELKALSAQDPMKNDQDKASYNSEFHDLQVQLYSIAQTEFNGVSLFASHNDISPFQQEVWFLGDNDAWAYDRPNDSWDHTQTVFTSSSGSSGSKVSIHKLPLLSALTIDNHFFEKLFTGVSVPELSSVPYGVGNSGNADANGSEKTSFVARFAVNPDNETSHLREFLDLADISVGVFNKALENVAFLRAQNGGGQARLLFSLESLGREKINTRSSVNRVVGLDIAEQSISLAKETILVNISAAILAQANASSDIALMLLR